MSGRSEYVLIVDDDELARKTVGRLVQRLRPTLFCASVEEARAELESRTSWCGFLFDVMIGQDARGGLALLELASSKFPAVPIGIMTGAIERDVVNRSATKGAFVLAKPFGMQELLPFFQRVVAREHEFRPQVSSRLDAVAREWSLSPRQHEILAWLVSGRTRTAYLAKTGIADTTMKTHVQSMLQKSGTKNLPALVSKAFRLMMEEEAEPSSE